MRTRTVTQYIYTYMYVYGHLNTHIHLHMCIHNFMHALVCMSFVEEQAGLLGTSLTTSIYTHIHSYICQCSNYTCVKCIRWLLFKLPVSGVACVWWLSWFWCIIKSHLTWHMAFGVTNHTHTYTYSCNGMSIQICYVHKYYCTNKYNFSKLSGSLSNNEAASRKRFINKYCGSHLGIWHS